jgi:hypothetical protein
VGLHVGCRLSAIRSCTSRARVLAVLWTHMCREISVASPMQVAAPQTTAAPIELAQFHLCFSTSQIQCPNNLICFQSPCSVRAVAGTLRCGTSSSSTSCNSRLPLLRCMAVHKRLEHAAGLVRALDWVQRVVRIVAILRHPWRPHCRAQNAAVR